MGKKFRTIQEIIQEINVLNTIDEKIKKIKGISKAELGEKNVLVGSEDIVVIIPQNAKDCRKITQESLGNPLKHTIDYDEYELYLDAMDYASVAHLIPYNANPRFFDSKKGVAADQMRTCMTDSKISNLGDNSLGVIINTNYLHITENGEIKLTFKGILEEEKSYMGIENGGTLTGTLIRMNNLKQLKEGHIVKLVIRNYRTDKLSREQELSCIRSSANINNTANHNHQNSAIHKGYLKEITKDLPNEYKAVYIEKQYDANKEGKKYYDYNDVNIVFAALLSKVAPKFKVSKIYGGGKNISSKVENEFDKTGSYIYEPARPLLKDILDIIKYIEYHWTDKLIDYMSMNPKVYFERLMKLSKVTKYSREDGTSYYKLGKSNYNETVFTENFPDIQPSKDISVLQIEASEEFYERLKNDENYLRSIQSYLKSLKLPLRGSGNIKGMICCILYALGCNVGYDETTDLCYFIEPDYITLLNESIIDITKIFDEKLTDDVRNLEKLEVWDSVYNSVLDKLNAMLMRKRNM